MFETVAIASSERYSALLSVQLPATTSDTLYVLAASTPRPPVKQWTEKGWSPNVLPPRNYVYLRPSPSPGPFEQQQQQQSPPLGARILKMTASGHVSFWGTEAVPLETLEELVLEVRNDSYFIDECSLLNGGHSSAAIAPLVASGSALSPHVRLHQKCQAVNPSCHAHLRLAVKRSFLKRHLPPNVSRYRAICLARIQCTLVSFSDASAPVSDETGSVYSEESAVFRRALQNLGFEQQCPVCFFLRTCCF